MNIEAIRDPRFLIRWIRVSFYGWTSGFVLILVLLGITGSLGLGETQFSVGLGMGAGTGFFQGRLIGSDRKVARAWLMASAMGLAAPFIVSDAARLSGLGIRYWLAALVVAGGSVAGVLQWRIMNRALPRAGWWIVASVLAWSAAALPLFFNERFLPRIPGIIGALLYIGIILTGGLFLGVIGGLALVRLADTRGMGS